MKFYVVKRFKGASKYGSEENEVLTNQGLFRTKEEASAVCKKMAEGLYEWAKGWKKKDLRIFEGSTKNWCVEFLNEPTDEWHEFYNWHIDAIYVNE